MDLKERMVYEVISDWYDSQYTFDLEEARLHCKNLWRTFHEEKGLDGRVWIEGWMTIDYAGGPKVAAQMWYMDNIGVPEPSFVEHYTGEKNRI